MEFVWKFFEVIVEINWVADCKICVEKWVGIVEIFRGFLWVLKNYKMTKNYEIIENLSKIENENKSMNSDDDFVYFFFKFLNLIRINLQKN